MQDKVAEKDSIKDTLSFSNTDVTDKASLEKIHSSMILNDNSFVLDIGSGVGRQIELLKNNKTENIVALDLSLNLMQHCKMRLKRKGFNNVFYVVADAEKLPFKDKVFDDCLCLGVLHHFSEFTTLIKEVNSVVKEQANIYTIDPNGLNFVEALWLNLISKILRKSKLFRKLFNGILIVNPNERAITEREIVKVFTKNGFRKKRISYNMVLLNERSFINSLRRLLYLLAELILPKKYGKNVITTHFVKIDNN